MEDKFKTDGRWLWIKTSCCRLLFRRLKNLLQLLLLAVFLYFFGLPAIAKYQEGQTMVVKSKVDMDGIAAPTITIAVRNPTTKYGWKDHVQDEHLDQVCNNTGETSNVESCIDRNTYSQEEAFHDILVGYNYKKSLMANDICVEDFTDTWPGKYFTIQLPGKLRPYVSTQVFLELHKDLNYLIFIHDPNYFFYTDSPAIPLLNFEVKPKKETSHYYRLRLTEVEELDQPEHPCDTDPAYNFQACVRESLSSLVGCRTKWDVWSHKAMPLCTNMAQFR